MTILLLEHSFEWFGKHAGLGLLREHLLRNGCPVESIYPMPGAFHRMIGKAYSTALRLPARNQTTAAAEMRFALKLRMLRYAGHVLNIEYYLPLAGVLKGNGNWVATLHQPRRWWTPEMLDQLREVPRLIVLSENFISEFSDVLPRSRMTLLPHGVNAEFFRPNEEMRCRHHKHLLYVGTWLRNSQMFSRLVPRIAERFPDVVFDLVVPGPARTDPALTALLHHPAVRWHQNLSDDELRNLYQKATGMLMPMEDSGANNAIVEALASGLPILTTDAGGIRSYGGGTIFPLVANNDDEALLEMASDFLADTSLRESTGAAARRFAVEHLDWTVAARKYMETYRTLGFMAR